jgi:Cu+-exporting ATPase
VLIKNAEALEILEKVDTLVVDKTGTLTEGKPRVVSINVVAGSSETDLLRLAASLEQGSEHPLAPAILAAAKERGVALEKLEGFQSYPGLGISGKLHGSTVAAGTEKLLADLGIRFADTGKKVAELRARGETVVLVASGGRVAGMIGIADSLKSSTLEALKAIHALGLRVVMLTGDNYATSSRIAAQLNIEELHAGILPEKKAEVISSLQKQGRVVAMAGDGVNDAPALAQANVGIAMSNGTDVAIESAGITLVKGDLRGIVRALKLSRAAMRNIRQNLFFAFIYNSVGVPIAAGILYPFFGWLLSPVFAAAAMSLSSVSVISNSLRLRNVKL